MIILGISRDNLFSPMRGDVDKAIFEAVRKQLRHDGHEVFTIDEVEFGHDGVSEPEVFSAVFSMARSDRALEQLSAMEKLGCPAVNSSQAVLSCRRVRSAQMLLEAGVPFAYSEVSSDGRIPEEWNRWPCWIKRGDSHALYADDVCHADDASAAEHILSRVEEPGPILFQEHIPGQIIKVYGVAGKLFKFVKLASAAEGKYGLERYNVCGSELSPNAALLEQICEKAASVLGVKAYGADAIVGEDGSLTLIDFNDWPSFSFCRAEAAAAIAALVEESASK